MASPFESYDDLEDADERRAGIVVAPHFASRIVQIGLRLDF